MRMPGFTAEASLSETSEHDQKKSARYGLAAAQGKGYAGHQAVVPQMRPVDCMICICTATDGGTVCHDCRPCS